MKTVLRAKIKQRKENDTYWCHTGLSLNFIMTPIEVPRRDSVKWAMWKDATA